MDDKKIKTKKQSDYFRRRLLLAPRAERSSIRLMTFLRRAAGSNQVRSKPWGTSVEMPPKFRVTVVADAAAATEED